MDIRCDFPISSGSIKEFVRVLLSDKQDIEVDVETLEVSKEITLKVTVREPGSDEEIEHIAKFKNVEDRIDDQRVIMIKIALLNIYKKKLLWGGLIGVRPTKLVRRMLALKMKYHEVEEILMGLYGVSKEKTDLLIKVVKKEMEYLNRDNINIYIGIPFCPTKCRYCSFASYEIGGPVGKFYSGVVDTLLEEIELTGEFFKSYPQKIESIYIGGGTPSVLKEEDMERILQKIRESFDMSNIKEFTFEGGRVDTLNRKKLEILKKHGVDRISINPQTFNEEVLKDLNRTFNRQTFDEIYTISKELGLIINMDLIFGLPGEGIKEILYTLKELEKYSMENLTIHMLALKRASKLYQENHEIAKVDRDEVSKKLKELLEEKGLEPYYMYRQKNSIDWGENLGYAIKGSESIFNIEMIEENQSTFGLGGGAITKRITSIDGVTDKIEKVVNPKDPALYIKEMRERLEKKFDLFKGL